MKRLGVETLNITYNNNRYFINFHRSGSNTTDSMRRVYLAQYAKEPIRGANGEQFGLAEPFLKGGEVVAAQE